MTLQTKVSETNGEYKTDNKWDAFTNLLKDH